MRSVQENRNLPGDREVLMNGATLSPILTAFWASKPAPSMTEGFDVFVQLVMAAITTDPCRSLYSFPSSHVIEALVEMSLAAISNPLNPT